MKLPVLDSRGLCSVCGLREGHREWCADIAAYLTEKYRLQDEDRLCEVVDCGRRHWAKGMCQRHYNARRLGRPVAA